MKESSKGMKWATQSIRASQTHAVQVNWLSWAELTLQARQVRWVADKWTGAQIGKHTQSSMVVMDLLVDTSRARKANGAQTGLRCLSLESSIGGESGVAIDIVQYLRQLGSCLWW